MCGQETLSELDKNIKVLIEATKEFTKKLEINRRRFERWDEVAHPGVTRPLSSPSKE